MQDVMRMSLGQVVDFCIEYNNRHKEQTEKAETKSAPVTKYRLATRDEVKAYFGR